MTNTVGVYMLAPKHAAAIEAVAGAVEVLHGQRAQDFVADRVAAREAGKAHTFAIEDRTRLLGLCELRTVTGDGAEIDVWIAEPFRRRGHAKFAIGVLLEFAFTNLRLAQVEAVVRAGHDAMPRALSEHGFEPRPGGDGAATRHAIDPVRWRTRRNAPAVARLVPSLRALLDAELAAGNEIVESSIGWPDADSVFVRLRRPFHAVPQPLPAGVRHHQLDDPHWWKAEYASDSPRQIIAY